MKYFIYILENKTKKHYIGCSSDPLKRLNEHNGGKTKPTRSYRPWKIIYTEQFADKKEAYKREWHLKHPAGYIEKNNIIKQYGEVA